MSFKICAVPVIANTDCQTYTRRIQTSDFESSQGHMEDFFVENFQTSTRAAGEVHREANRQSGS
ncbi:MAG: hypothetical protein DMF00_16495 [Verrucomicrobia bacterium]|nr:MAG: hypothetical protein DMF00_16495 [Verrucomicrobiota bacterium]